VGVRLKTQRIAHKVTLRHTIFWIYNEKMSFMELLSCNIMNINKNNIKGNFIKKEALFL